MKIKMFFFSLSFISAIATPFASANTQESCFSEACTSSNECVVISTTDDMPSIWLPETIELSHPMPSSALEYFVSFSGMSIEAVRQELVKGLSLNEIAASRNISKETLLDYILEEEKKFTNSVQDAIRQQEQALGGHMEHDDAFIKQHVLLELNEKSIDPLLWVANRVGLNEEQLVNELVDGNSLKSIAEAKSLDVATLKNDLKMQIGKTTKDNESKVVNEEVNHHLIKAVFDAKGAAALKMIEILHFEQFAQHEIDMLSAAETCTAAAINTNT